MITCVDPCGYVKLDIPLDVIESYWHSGDCDDVVTNAMLIPTIKEQLSKIDNDTLIKSLCEVYDDAVEYCIANAPREQNELRALWIACSNAQEGMEYKKGQNVYLVIDGEHDTTIWTIVDIEGDKVSLVSEYGQMTTACTKDLKPSYCALNYAQTQAIEELRAAYKKCKELNVKFAYDHHFEIMYALNACNIKDACYDDCLTDKDKDHKCIDNVNAILAEIEPDYTFDGNDECEYNIVFY